MVIFDTFSSTTGGISGYMKAICLNDDFQFKLEGFHVKVALMRADSRTITVALRCHVSDFAVARSTSE